MLHEDLAIANSCGVTNRSSLQCQDKQNALPVMVALVELQTTAIPARPGRSAIDAQEQFLSAPEAWLVFASPATPASAENLSTQGQD